MFISKSKCHAWDSTLGSCVSEHVIYSTKAERDHLASQKLKEGFVVHTRNAEKAYYVYWRYHERNQNVT